MPTYIYTPEVDSDEGAVELVMTIAEMERREKNGFIQHDGATLVRRIDLEVQGTAFGGCSSTWPKKSIALGTIPQDVGRMAKIMDAKGVPTEFAPTGEAIIRDRSHRTKVLKALGRFDRDGGYGDG